MNCKHENIDKIDENKSYCKDCGEEFVKEGSEPKLISRDLIYRKIWEDFKVRINGKEVIVKKTQEYDKGFNDHDFEIDIQDTGALTDEEHDIVYDFVEELE